MLLIVQCFGEDVFSKAIVKTKSLQLKFCSQVNKKSYTNEGARATAKRADD